MATINFYIIYLFLLLIYFIKFNYGRTNIDIVMRKDFCERLNKINKAHLHPSCKEFFGNSKKTRFVKRKKLTTLSVPIIKEDMSNENDLLEPKELIHDEIHDCRNSDTILQCKTDSVNCPKSGQICSNTDNTVCCQNVIKSIPVSHINSKPGNCPTPIGIFIPQDATVGCWLDQNCPGIQKCCLEPNPSANTATRLCRDPINIPSHSVCNLPLSVGVCNAPTIRYYYDSVTGKCRNFQYSGCGGNKNNFQTLASCQANCGSAGIMGNPECPMEANISLNCLFAHPDACKTDSDCMGRINTKQPSCCMTKCGYRICHQY
uniref:BPTI/Kunitz inhibitor domain-containing protein n=1 Tax=Strongyloides papillosus TaxID=174720 RepID=A0A0N5C799_STREA